MMMALTKESYLMVKDMVKVFSTSLTEKSIMESGRTIKCTV